MATQTDEMFVHIEKLKDNDTFPVWKFQTMIVLKSMNLYEIVCGQNALRLENSKQAKAEWVEERRSSTKDKSHVIIGEIAHDTHIDIYDDQRNVPKNLFCLRKGHRTTKVFIAARIF